MTDPKGTWSDGGKVWNGEPMQDATICPHCQATVLSTSKTDEQFNFVAVPKSALAWLFGEGPDTEGKQFGECEDAIEPIAGKYLRKYWWRSRFRVMIEDAALAATPAVGGEAVAWRVRLAGGNYQITSYSDTATMWRDGGANVEPLYAAPPASPLRGRDSERCPTCHHTDEEYAAGDWTCADPWHADDHFRAKVASPPEHPAAARPPMLADVAQIIQDGWYAGRSSVEVAEQILREFDAAPDKETQE